MRLVADLGGTNCRLALLPFAGGQLQAIQSFANADFPSFTALLERYLSEQNCAPKEMVVAVAGPVGQDAQGQIAKITNRDWLISARDLSAQFGKAKVHLMNDLSALGHSLTNLGEQDLVEILPCAGAAHQPQRLVVGIGTGFNVSPVLTTPQGVTCLATEYGHVGLPQDIYQNLVDELGPAAERFQSVECCFSGRGFAALHAACFPERNSLSGADIMARVHEGEAEAVEFTHFYAQLLALLSRNLLKGFLPRGGIYFAGTVARSLLTSPARTTFAEAFSQPDPQFPDISAPAYCILDDGAALKGCVGFAFAQTE